MGQYDSNGSTLSWGAGTATPTALEVVSITNPGGQRAEIPTTGLDDDDHTVALGKPKPQLDCTVIGTSFPTETTTGTVILSPGDGSLATTISPAIVVKVSQSMTIDSPNARDITFKKAKSL